MQTIYLDISNKGVIPSIYAKQHDVGRKFRAVLTDGGVPYNEAENSAFSVWYEGASGEGNYTHIGEESAFSVNGNVVEVELIEQMLANYGNTIACLVMSSANGDQIATWNIQITAETVPGFDSEPAEEYFTAFSQTAAQVKRDADRAVAAASTFVVDDTLSISGASADAAATGDAINALRDSIDELPSQIIDNTLSEEGKAADAKAVGDRLSAISDLVKIAAPVNVLDNSDWTNPVNQRGQTSYDAGGYTIDRWKSEDNNVYSVIRVNEGYVTLTGGSQPGYIIQAFEGNALTAGENYTAAIWLLDGRILVNNGVIPQTGNVQFRIDDSVALQVRLASDMVSFLLYGNGVSLDIKHIAVYKGAYTAETLPEYHPKGYGAELAECQRYYQKLTSTEMAACHKVVGTSSLVIPLSVKYPMRIAKPTIAGSVDALAAEGWMTGSVPTLKNTITGFVANAPATATGYTFESGKTYLCRGTIELSADL